MIDMSQTYESIEISPNKTTALANTNCFRINQTIFLQITNNSVVQRRRRRRRLDPNLIQFTLISYLCLCSSSGSGLICLEKSTSDCPGQNWISVTMAYSYPYDDWIHLNASETRRRRRRRSFFNRMQRWTMQTADNWLKLWSKPLFANQINSLRSDETSQWGA